MRNAQKSAPSRARTLSFFIHIVYDEGIEANPRRARGEEKGMFGVERFEKIIGMLKTEQAVSVRTIAKTLYVSEATVRRDLAEMEKSGLVERIYGGAMLVKSNRDVPLSMRESEYQEAKNQIGRKAAALVRENDVLIIDASSTAFSMIQYLDFKNIVVITNGLKTAVALGERHIKTIVTGGQMIDNSYCVVGQDAMRLLEHISADIIFFSCRGITRSGDMCDSSIDEAQLRMTMCRHAKRRVLLAASSKFGKEFFYLQGHISDMDDVLCETDIPAPWRGMLAAQNAPREAER